MKKIVLITVLLMSVFLFSCGKKEAEQYSVSFVINDKTYVQEFVNSGDDLTDFPVIEIRSGYTIEWDKENLKNITENIVVTGREIPKEYTIEYDLAYEGSALKEENVLFDSEYKLDIPERENFRFTGWYDGDGNKADEKGIWKIADNVKLKANWQEVYKITFKIRGMDDIVVSVDKDKSIDESQIPVIPEISGYEVHWEDVDFSKCVNKNTEIKAIFVPKLYNIIYNLNINDAVIESKNQQVAYNAFYNLYVPERFGYTFVKWVDENGKEVLNGVYNTEGDIKLSAVWEIDDSDDMWTDIY